MGGGRGRAEKRKGERVRVKLDRWTNNFFE